MNNKDLREKTPPEWTKLVIERFDEFLPDHAAAEKKASSMALTMIAHYPDREKLVLDMADLAIEELNHYREVIKLIYERGLQLQSDTKDAYVGSFRKHIRKSTEEYFLDRLLVAGVIEARGAERFGLLADGLPDGTLKNFYRSITRSEQRHEGLFTDLARLYFPKNTVEQRLDELLDAEASIVQQLPITPCLH